VVEESPKGGNKIEVSEERVSKWLPSIERYSFSGRTSPAPLVRPNSVQPPAR